MIQPNAASGRTLRLSQGQAPEAAAILGRGGLVAIPTETVYGLAARAGDPVAVARVFEAKDRPRFNPLIVHAASVEAAFALGMAGEEARRLAAAFWPGPLTLVLPLAAPLPHLVTAGSRRVAVRVPAHPLALEVLAALGEPVAAPSANPSGRISPTTAEHVLAGLDGRIEAVIDGGPCAVGLESAIVGLGDGPPRLLRPGGVPSEAIEAVLGRTLARGGEVAPGGQASHYAPRGAVRLDATGPRPGERMLGFGAVPGELTLSASGDLREAAGALFAALHALDATGDPIAVAPIPDEGLGRAIRDRLARAAAPRD